MYVLIIGLLSLSELKSLPQEPNAGDTLWHLNTSEVMKALDENRELPNGERLPGFPLASLSHLSQEGFVITTVTLTTNILQPGSPTFPKEGDLFCNPEPFKQGSQPWGCSR